VRAARRAADVGPWPRRRDRFQTLRSAGFEPGAEPAGLATPGAHTLLLPVGVVGLRSPAQVVPALAAGNAVVLVARGALALAERLDGAELPSGVFNLVDGTELKPHPGIDLLRSPPGEPITIRLDEVDDDEAMRLAGSADRVALFGGDLARAHRIAHALPAEHVWIDTPPTDVADAPEGYTRLQTVYVP
jgi:acyl-CoA reductase-like NAD-dependent aldehyde dehydrogenase